MHRFEPSVARVLEKRGEAQDGAWGVCEGIDELAAGISYPEYTGEGEVNAVCETLQALVEEVAYFEPYPDTHHRYCSWNHVSGLALMEDERGYPTLDSSQLPSKADMAIAHKRVRGIVVPTRTPNPLGSAVDPQPSGLETFVGKGAP